MDIEDPLTSEDFLDPRVTAKHFIQVCNQLIKTSDYSMAVRVCDFGLSMFPQCPNLHDIRGFACLRLDHFKESVKSYSNALKVDPSSSFKYLFNRASCYRSMTEYRLALTDTRACISKKPHDPQPYYLRGLCLYDMELYEKALTSFNCAISRDNTVAAFYNHRGLTYRELERLDLAISDFERAVHLSPSTAMYSYNWGLCLADIGEDEEACGAFSRAISLDDTDPTYFNNRSNMYCRLGLIEEAVADATSAIELGAEAIHYSNRAVLLQMKGDTSLALKDHAKAIRMEPNNPLFRTCRAQTYLQINRVRDALKDVNKAISLSPSQPDLEPLLLRGSIHSHLNNIHDALNDFSSVLLRDPQHVKAYIERGTLYAQVKEYTKALSDLDDAFDLEGDMCGEIWLTRAEVHFHLGNDDKALHDVNNSIERDEDCDRSFVLRSDIHAASGRWSPAVCDMNRAIFLSPSNANYYAKRGLLFQKKQIELSVADFNRAIELQPDEGVFYAYRGDSFTLLERFDLAEMQYSEAINRCPEYRDCLFFARARAYMEQKKYKEAVKDLKRIKAEKDESYVDVLTLSATCLIYLERDEEAITCLEEAIRIPCSPGNDRVEEYMELGELFSKRNLLGRAIQVYTEVLSVEPSNATVWYMRAQLHVRLNQFDDALRDLCAAIERDDMDPLFFRERAGVYSAMRRFKEAERDREMYQSMTYLL